MQNYPIITSVEETRKGILYISVDSSDSFPPATDLPERRQEGFANPLSLQKAGSPHPQGHMAIQSGHVTFASQCII